MDYRRFDIGTTVGVSSTIAVAYDNEGQKRIYKALGPVNGMIIGLKRLMLGKYEPSGYVGGNGYCEPLPEEAYLNVSETIVVWVIKTGLFNKPIYALDEDVVEACIPLYFQLPVLHQNKNEWTSLDRQCQREYMANVPRDQRGRWVKQ